MLFYKVPEKYDQYPIYKKTGNVLQSPYYYVAGELYTEKEYSRLMKKYVCIKPSALDLVSVPKNKTYWFFGSRFQA